MLAKCSICRGGKKMMKMGGIEGNCAACDGEGYVAVDKAIKIAEDTPKKRTRRTKAELEISDTIQE